MMPTGCNITSQFTWDHRKAKELKKHVFHEQTVHSWETKIKQKKETFHVNGNCNNRECNNPPGYESKPKSIYCSSKCQSRGNDEIV